MTTYPSVTSLIPHRSPMLLVERVLDVQEKTGVARAVVGKEHLFLREDGTLAPEVHCELIAQGFGVCEGYRRTQKGLSMNGGGFLSSLREVQLFAPVYAGDELTVYTEKTDTCFDTHIVRGEVWRGSEKLAQAVVYVFVWQGEEPPSSL